MNLKKLWRFSSNLETENYSHKITDNHKYKTRLEKSNGEWLQLEFVTEQISVW